jgi:hypothetical protein
MSPLLFVLALATLAAAQAPPPPATPPAPQAPTPAPAAPAAPAAAAPVQAPDPATLAFPPDTHTGLVLVTVKADRTADYDAVLARLQQALAATTDEARQRQAQGWQVFRAAEKDGKGNAVYVHVIAAPVAGLDYRPSLVLDALVEALAPELLVKYRDAFAAPPVRLSLGLLGALGAAPVKPAPRQ